MSRKLSPCPNKPNCVQSIDSQQASYISPLVLPKSEPGHAWQLLKSVVQSLPGVQLIIVEEAYMHIEFTSRWLRFVDDVELLLDEQNSCVHMRSASRVGYYDFGANRKRLEKISTLFQEKQNQ